jgi:hypothetical protein
MKRSIFIVANVLMVSLTMLQARPAFAAPMSACELRPQLRDAVLRNFFRAKKCEEITAAVMAKIEKLKIYDVDQFEDGDFNAFPALKTLDIEGSQAAALPERLFVPLIKLQELSIGKFQNVKTIPPALLKGPLSLGSFVLTDFPSVQSLPGGLFQSQRRLRNISIYNLGLQEIPLGLFQGLTNLRSLRLLVRTEHKDVPVAEVNLPEGSLADLWSIKEVYLSGLILPVGTFQRLSTLLDLNIYSSKLIPGTFAGLVQATRLSLRTSFPLQAGVFAGLESLEELWIERSDLGNIPEDAFSGLLSL